MSPVSDFVAHILDLLASWGGVSARRMFSGYGVFRKGVMFALVADDALYLKVDERTRGDFAAAGMTPFVYSRKRRAAPIELSYWQAPPELLEDGEEMLRWARRALDAALAARRPARPATLSRPRPAKAR